MADNYRFDVSGADLTTALALAFVDNRTVKGWRVQARQDEPPRLILYWYVGNDKDVTLTPAPLNLEASVALVQQWLDATPWDPKHPWNEVQTKKGSRVYNEQWGHLDGAHGAFVAVEPYQLWYGK
ncbi:hypothetical protein [Microbacterium sp. BR1]|uniref:hypothetical protein n=1 Tax=Microbacterium sp. BR1 TaxID=1070896 RepID=UPI000C2C3DDA|nr:hypothetical protein [Microbacterium sp. BR1]